MKKYMSPTLETMGFDVDETVANILGPSGFIDVEFGGW